MGCQSTGCALAHPGGDVLAHFVPSFSVHFLRCAGMPWDISTCTHADVVLGLYTCFAVFVCAHVQGQFCVSCSYGNCVLEHCNQMQGNQFFTPTLHGAQDRFLHTYLCQLVMPVNHSILSLQKRSECMKIQNLFIAKPIGPADSFTISACLLYQHQLPCIVFPLVLVHTFTIFIYLLYQGILLQLFIADIALMFAMQKMYITKASLGSSKKFLKKRRLQQVLCTILWCCGKCLT